MKKRFLSLCTIVFLLAGGILQTSATEMICDNGVFLPANNNEYFNVFLKYGVTSEIITAPNWDIRNDTSVSVKFYSSKGPSQCYVAVYYKEDSADEWTFADAELLLIGETMSCDIPADYSFKVEAISQGGNNGNVTFEVSLS